MYACWEAQYAPGTLKMSHKNAQSEKVAKGRIEFDLSIQSKRSTITNKRPVYNGKQKLAAPAENDQSSDPKYLIALDVR